MSLTNPTRRDFLKTSAGLAAAGAATGIFAQAEETTSGKIVYVRKDVPAIPLKPYRGTTYEDRVPDTYDIAERAKLAINGLTGPLDPAADYELYWWVSFDRNPVIMYHDFNDWVQGKFMEALPLLRLVTGSKQNDHVDRVWWEVMLKSIGLDGLYYIPFEGRPWGQLHPYPRVLGVARPDGSITSMSDRTVKQFSHPANCGRMMGALTVYWLRDGNPILKKMIERMIDRQLELVVHKDDYCYLPPIAFEPNAKYDPNDKRVAMPKKSYAMASTWHLGNVGRYFALCGYKPAGQLAGKLSRFMRLHAGFFGPNGEFMGDGRHFHGHTYLLLGMLECGLAAGDNELIQFVRKGYEWAKIPAAASSPLIGFFPEYANPNYLSCESCEIGDMIALALKFSSGGVHDYYEDAERWARNHFAESQLTEYEWVYRNAEKYPKSKVRFNETADRVLERNVGAFAGSSGGNDWWIQSVGIMHCCTGNCARAIYYIWRHILDYEDGRLRINMLLNRASPWADVYGYIPYEGRVDIKTKTDCKSLSVHAPEWIPTESDQITATVNGKAREFGWEGRYINLGEVKSGSTVVVKFPISERTVKETIGRVDYTLVVKGNTVVSIDPPGKKCPLYQRDHYRKNQVRWRKVKRFVSDEDVNY